MSEIKDKVVSLEILKVVYDELKEETSQLSEEIDGLNTGLSVVEKKHIISLFRNTVYIKDMSETIDALEDAFNSVPATSIKLSVSSLKFLSIGSSQTITATLSPLTATSSVFWESSNEDVVTVKDGVVASVAEGTATITATSGTATATCEVIVNVIEVVSVTNNLTNVTTTNSATEIEEETAYTATLTPDDGYSFSSVIVTMGGVDITTSAYSDGAINIPSVTGDIVITASAYIDDNLITAEILAETGAGTLPDGTNKDGTELSITPFIEVEPGVTYTHNLLDYIPDGHYSYELKIAKYDADQTSLGVYQIHLAGGKHTAGDTEKYVKLMLFTGHPNPYFGESGVIV